jgi:hypothetical protein
MWLFDDRELKIISRAKSAKDAKIYLIKKETRPCGPRINLTFRRILT